MLQGAKGRAWQGQHEPSHLGWLSTHHDCTSLPLDPHTLLRLASPLFGSDCLCHPCDDLRIMPGTEDMCICRSLVSFNYVSSQLIDDDAVSNKRAGTPPAGLSFFPSPCFHRHVFLGVVFWLVVSTPLKILVNWDDYS